MLSTLCQANPLHIGYLIEYAKHSRAFRRLKVRNEQSNRGLQRRTIFDSFAPGGRFLGLERQENGSLLSKEGYFRGSTQIYQLF